MVRFKVGTAQKRTDKSPESIYIWVLLSLSLSLSLWGAFMFVQDLTQHRDSSGMCPTASWQTLGWENLLTTTGHDDDLAKRLEASDKLALVESLFLLSWFQNSDTSSVLEVWFVRTEAWLQSSAASALSWEAEATQATTGRVFPSVCLKAWVTSFPLPIRGCDRLQELEDAM
jgi:hypothetical protein